MKIALCVASILLVLSNGCIADTNENAIFKSFNEGWIKYGRLFVFKGYLGPERFNFGLTQRLCPVTTLFDFTIKNIVNVKELDTHVTPLEMENASTERVFNESPQPRERETSASTFTVTETAMMGKSDIVPLSNAIVYNPNGIGSDVFRVGAKKHRAARADNTYSYEKLNSTERVISVPSQTVTVPPHSEVHVRNYLYSYSKVKNYLLDIEIDRPQSKVNWNKCRVIRVLHWFRPSSFERRDTEDHVRRVWADHQQDFSGNEGKIEYFNGKMIIKNVPVQMVYKMHKVDSILDDENQNQI